MLHLRRSSVFLSQRGHRGRSAVPVTMLACIRKMYSSITNRCQLHMLARGSTPTSRHTVGDKVRAMWVIAYTRKIRSNINIHINFQQLLIQAKSSSPLNRSTAAGKVLTTLGIASIRNLRSNSPNSPWQLTWAVNSNSIPLNNHMPSAEAGLMQRRRGKEASRLPLNFRIVI